MRPLILIFCIISPLFALGQINGLVKLKNGSVMKGEIIQVTDTVTIKLANGSVIKLPMAEVGPTEKGSGKRPILFYATGSLLVGSIYAEFDGALGLSYRMSGLYRVESSQLLLGLTSGVDFYSIPFIPLMPTAQIDLSKGNNIPFLHMAIGYGVPVNVAKGKTESGGLGSNLMFGMKFRSALSNRSFVVSIGRRAFTSKVTYNNLPFAQKNSGKLNQLEFSLGIFF